MTYLLTLLLLFGLIQSFLELKKKKKIKAKWSIEKLLSILYVLGFIVGFIVIIVQSQDNNKSSQALDYITFSVKKIDSSSLKQVERLNQSFEETKRLLRLTDSMNQSLKLVIDIRNSLIAQTETLNQKLSAQISNDLKIIELNKPTLAIIESDLKWIKLDSISRGINICVRNLGNRSAIVTSFEGKMLFFNKENQIIYTLVIPKNSNETLLQPTHLADQRLCPSTKSIKEIEKIFGKVFFAGVYIRVNYKDIIDKSLHTTTLYSGWNSKYNDFVKLTDSQLKLVKSFIVQ